MVPRCLPGSACQKRRLFHPQLEFYRQCAKHLRCCRKDAIELIEAMMSEMGMYRYCYSLDCNSTDVSPFAAVRPCQHLQSRARERSGYSDCVSTAILTSFTSLHT